MEITAVIFVTILVLARNPTLHSACTLVGLACEAINERFLSCSVVHHAVLQTPHNVIGWMSCVLPHGINVIV